LPSAVKAYEGRYPLWLLEAIDWAMALAPLDRPQTASELRDALLTHAQEILAEWSDSEASGPASQRERSDFSGF
jgi:hypothetical protein